MTLWHRSTERVSAETEREDSKAEDMPSCKKDSFLLKEVDFCRKRVGFGRNFGRKLSAEINIFRQKYASFCRIQPISAQCLILQKHTFLQKGTKMEKHFSSIFLYGISKDTEIRPLSVDLYLAKSIAEGTHRHVSHTWLPPFSGNASSL